MKKIVFLLFFMMFLATGCFSRIDDKNIQIFNLPLIKTIGLNVDNCTEDSFYLTEFQNLFYDGNGVSSFKYQETGETYFKSLSNSYYLDDGMYFNSRLYYNYSDGSDAICLDSMGNQCIPDWDGYPGFIYTFKTISQNAGITDHSSVQTFVFNRKAMYCTDEDKKLTGLSIYSGTHPISACIWNNRLFCLCGSTLLNQYSIYYSNATDKTKFSDSDGIVNVINIPDFEICFRIISNNYGVYIFSTNGIYLLTGGTDELTWNISKISNIIPIASYHNVINYKGTIYFLDYDGLNVLNGTQVNSISRSPFTTFYPGKSDIIDGRFLVFSKGESLGEIFKYTISKDSYSYFYDLKNKSWGKFNTLVFPVKKYAIRNTTSYYYFYAISNIDYSTGGYYLSPFKLKTNWTTFGFPGLKEIKRIEIDLSAYTTTPIEKIYYKISTIKDGTETTVTNSFKPKTSYSISETERFANFTKVFYPNIIGRRFNLEIYNDLYIRNPVNITGIRVYFRYLGENGDNNYE